MTDSKQEVWITGIGLLSCHGEGNDLHWEALKSADAASAPIDTETFAPYAVHPIPEIDWTRQMSRKDMRQMENWQRLGTYAAGMALADSGMKEVEELVSTMDLVVCAGGGERDLEVDTAILAEAQKRNDRDMIINERLPNDLRPTLFLAQLSNLMAGNISIVHKVTGSSRTYMGEESAGVTAIRDACARIAHGQSTHALVGGGYNAERPDLFLNMELDHYLARGTRAPVIARQDEGGGLIPGSGAAFLVLESGEHARERGVTPYAKITGVASGFGARSQEATRDRLQAMLETLVPDLDHRPAVLSGSTGCEDITAWERNALQGRLGMEAAIRFYTSMIGNPVEANFPFGIGLAAIALKQGAFYEPFEPAEKPVKFPPSSILVSTAGHYRGEGMAMVEQIS